MIIFKDYFGRGEGFILTSFFTDKIKAGETVWER